MNPPTTSRITHHSLSNAGEVPTSDVLPTTSRRKTWLRAVRPKSLLIALSPVSVGTAVAINETGLRVLPLLACVAFALLLQVAANISGSASGPRKSAGTQRQGATVASNDRGIAAWHLKTVAGITLALAVLVGASLVYLGGFIVLAIGIVAVISYLAYISGPTPCGYAGIGDLLVFLLLGPVATAGTSFILSGQLTPLSLAAGVPVGCLVTAILAVTNLRNAETDRRIRKMTLAVRLGSNGAIAEYIVLLSITFVTPVVLYFLGYIGLWAFIPLVLVPLAIVTTRGILEETENRFDRWIDATFRMGLLFVLLFAGAIVN